MNGNFCPQEEAMTFHTGTGNYLTTLPNIQAWLRRHLKYWLMLLATNYIAVITVIL